MTERSWLTDADRTAITTLTALRDEEGEDALIAAWNTLPAHLRIRLRWALLAREKQWISDDTFLTYIRAGRGFGKTRTGAEKVAEWMTSHQTRVALVAHTFADGRDVMVEGESGLRVVLETAGLKENIDFKWNRSNGELVVRAGDGRWSTGKIYSSERPGGLRGPSHEKAWVDEPAKFTDAHLGAADDTTWSNLMLGLRLGRPQAIVTGTPKRNALTRLITEHPQTMLIVGSTYENLDNLAPTFRDEVISRYEGTRLGRQELNAELLEDVEGALWTSNLIEATRVQPGAVTIAAMERVVVGIDPAGSHRRSVSDETGLIAAGASLGHCPICGDEQHYFVWADGSGVYSPESWAKKAIRMYDKYLADRVIVEKNFGGDMVTSTLRTHRDTLPIRAVTASRGKYARAEPVAALYEQQKVHHVGMYAELEDQMVTWTADSRESPDRMDALVWAITDLALRRRRPGLVVPAGVGQNSSWRMN